MTVYELMRILQEVPNPSTTVVEVTGVEGDVVTVDDDDVVAASIGEEGGTLNINGATS